MHDEQVRKPEPWEDATPRPAQPRRRKRKKTKWEIFKERYLRLVVLFAGVVLLIFLVVGLIRLATGGPDPTEIPTETVEEAPTEVGPQAEEVLEPAKILAAQYDYDAAIELLMTFQGLDTRVELALDEYRNARNTLIVWHDNTSIPHISFQNLIVDPDRAFDGDSAARDYAKYNLTVAEFQAALDQMYRNNFVLVSMTDVAVPNAEGVFEATQIMLPAGKKPLIMSLLPAGYTLNRAGDGFARRLVVGEDGKITAEYIDITATRQYGAYDFVSVLEAFIAQHPDFSYHGARAVIGFDDDPEPLGYDMAKETDMAELKKVVQCLGDTGYEFASFSYEGVRYGDAEASEVKADVDAWKTVYGELLGDVEILIYAGGSDLLEYSGEKFNTLYSAGFRYFVGMDNKTKSWGIIADSYVRQDRRTINGTRITEDQKLLIDLFDADSIRDPERP